MLNPDEHAPTESPLRSGSMEAGTSAYSREIRLDSGGHDTDDDDEAVEGTLCKVKAEDDYDALYAYAAAVVAKLEDSDRGVQIEAVRALRNLPFEVLVPHAAAVVPWLSDSDWEVREEAREALGELPPGVLAAHSADVVPLLSHSDEGVRRAAAETLCKLQTQSLAKHGDAVVTAVVAAVPKAAERVLRETSEELERDAAAHPDPESRSAREIREDAVAVFGLQVMLSMAVHSTVETREERIQRLERELRAAKMLEGEEAIEAVSAPAAASAAAPAAEATAEPPPMGNVALGEVVQAARERRGQGGGGEPSPAGRGAAASSGSSSGVVTLSDLPPSEEGDICAICGGSGVDANPLVRCGFGDGRCIQESGETPRRACWHAACAPTLKAPRPEHVVCARHEAAARFRLHANLTREKQKQYTVLTIASYNNNKFDPSIPDDTEQQQPAAEPPLTEEDQSLLESEAHDTADRAIGRQIVQQGTAEARAERTAARAAVQAAQAASDKAQKGQKEAAVDPVLCDRFAGACDGAAALAVLQSWCEHVDAQALGSVRNAFYYAETGVKLKGRQCPPPTALWSSGDQPPDGYVVLVPGFENKGVQTTLRKLWWLRVGVALARCVRKGSGMAIGRCMVNQASSKDLLALFINSDGATELLSVMREFDYASLATSQDDMDPTDEQFQGDVELHMHNLRRLRDLGVKRWPGDAPGRLGPRVLDPDNPTDRNLITAMFSRTLEQPLQPARDVETTDAEGSSDHEGGAGGQLLPKQLRQASAPLMPSGCALLPAHDVETTGATKLVNRLSKKAAEPLKGRAAALHSRWTRD